MPGSVARRTLVLASLAVLAALLPPLVARAEPSFVYGPVLMEARPGSVLVALEARDVVPVLVEVTIGDGGTTRTFESAPAYRHVVRLDPLPDDAVVRYRVTAPRHAPAAGTYHTPPASLAGDVEFLAYGDNRDGDSVHAALVRTMTEVPGSFVLHLGDMVPTGGSDDEWDTFLRIATPLLRGRPLVPVLGNHELAAGSEARARYFEHIKVGAAKDAAFHVFDWGPVRVLSLDSNQSMEAGSDQHRFVVYELARARREAVPRAMVVGIHHGPFSSGHHGDYVPLAENGLIGMMRAAGVRLVLSGHDHDYERGDSNGLKYVVTGGGGSPLYTANRRRAGQLAFSPEHHFLHVRVSRGDFEVDAIRPDGSRLEGCRFGARGNWDCGPRGDAGEIRGEPPVRFYLDHPIGRAVCGSLIAVGLLAAAIVLYRRSRTP